MNWVVSGMKWIMLASGLLTATMLQAAFAPEDALQSLFGSSLSGPAAEIVVRNWGALIGLIGGMLVYGAFNPGARPLVLTVAGLSKLTFIGLILVFGADLIGRKAEIAICVDLVMVALFVVYLAKRPRHLAAN